MSSENPISPKVTAAALAGAITLILVWIADTVGGIEVPAEVASAVTILLMAAAAYLKTDPLRSRRYDAKHN